MLQLRSRTKLSGGDHGWLKARHHFTVDGSRPEHGALGCLVVWNDDEIAPRTGFPAHGHRDMEIVTFVRQGVVLHEDDSGGQGQLLAGQVQAMSAGLGIRHAELSGSDDVLKIFQIWLLPRQIGVEPRWATRGFPKEASQGQLQVLASGMAADADSGALLLNADARLLGGTLAAGSRMQYPLKSTRFGYLVPARGSVLVNGLRVEELDGVAIVGEEGMVIEAIDQAEVVLVDAG